MINNEKVELPPQTQRYHSQDEGLVPAGVEGGADGPGLLFGLVLRVRDELEFNVWVRQAVGVHRNQVSGFAHWKTCDRQREKTP